MHLHFFVLISMKPTTRVDALLNAAPAFASVLIALRAAKLTTPQYDNTYVAIAAVAALVVGFVFDF